ncbi:long-chain fatty acid--CoA ligase [Candidatus Woesearchaeota archaeon]|nr:long-chain fatty acid--CoA ligase [Candidatus Woesearchaeota archaeon]
MAKIIPEMLYESYAHYPNNIALQYKDTQNYRQLTYRELYEKVLSLTITLRKLGLKKSDKIGIFAENIPEWVIADLAILSIGAIVVPIYHKTSEKILTYMLKDSEIKAIFSGSKENDELLNRVKQKTPKLKYALTFDDPYMKTFLSVKDLEEAEKNKTIINEKDIATIVYTSGSTGIPKGVILTHENIISELEPLILTMNITQNDVVFSFLPLTHMFERVAGYYVPFSVGASILHTNNVTTFAEEVRKIQPTYINTVPRFLEKLYETIIFKVDQKNPISRALFYYALEIAKQYNAFVYDKKEIPLLTKILYNSVSRLVFFPVKHKFGNKFRFFVSGGAPLTIEIEEFFDAIGLLVLQGYGLTEAAPIVTVNTLQKHKRGTVGIPIADKVKIANDGEILAQGPNIMKAYLHKIKETKKTLSKHWLHTGDIGTIDEEGFLHITGRKKNLLVTSYGKKIAPEPIEEELVESKYITQAMLYGDYKPYITAIIVADIDEVMLLAKKLNLVEFCETKFQKSGNPDKKNNVQELLCNPVILQTIETEIAKVNQHLQDYEQIKKFAVIANEFTVENNQLTTTLKMRRYNILKEYKKEMDELYKKK